MVNEKYFASVQYKEGTELNNTELNVLRNLAENYGGNTYEKALNPQARLIAFTFSSECQAEKFQKVSQSLEKIALVRVGKM